MSKMIKITDLTPVRITRCVFVRYSGRDDPVSNLVLWRLRVMETSDARSDKVPPRGRDEAVVTGMSKRRSDEHVRVRVIVKV